MPLLVTLIRPRSDLPAAQLALIARYHQRPQPVGALARALGIHSKKLTCELRGIDLMPEARRVALWYLLG